jgi:SAM-dependent methyltransferase
VTDRPRANSFHLTLDAVVGPLPRPHWSLCPVRPTATVWPRGRVLFLRRDARVARYTSATRDFTDAELAAVAAAGQLYLDVSRKPALDDFARDLIQLAPSPVCQGCPASPACAGLFDPRTEDVFTRDDARVRALLASLRGVVIDLGCGEGPYADALAPAVAAGGVTYVGLDPDPTRLADLRHRWPAAQLHVADAEAPPPGLPQPDHVLVLRSWNHLRNPVQVVETFAGLLRPGGTLTVVDNVAFGVVRARRQAAAAEGSLAAFEHLRNDGLSDAHRRVLSAAPHLTLVDAWDVGPATSNQWLLRYRRAPR